MKRLIFLICAVVLLLDLGADGALGNVKYVGSHNAAKSSKSSVTSTNPTSGQVDSMTALPLENCGDSGPRYVGQPVSGGIVQSLDLNDFWYIGSSGGIPL
jgi:hypothetical protein